MKLLKGEIISNDKLNENLYKMTIFSPYVVKNCIPGQFVNIKCSSEGSLHPLLRRPFSIHDVEQQFKVFSILYTIKGIGTKYLSLLSSGDLVDFVGPLGNGIKISGGEKKDYLLIGGGIGIAPLFYLAKYLVEKKQNVFFAAGFKNNSYLFFEKWLLSLKIYYEIFSEDGSHGEKGMVSNMVSQRIDDFKNYEIFCCGPLEMYKALQSIFLINEIKAYALFEEIMACGVGVCKGCVIKVKNNENKNGFDYKTVCKDGPLFNLMEVIIE